MRAITPPPMREPMAMPALNADAGSRPPISTTVPNKPNPAMPGDAGCRQLP